MLYYSNINIATMKHLNLITLTCLTVLLSFTFSANAQIKQMFTEKQLPSVEITDLNGSTVNIADYGKTGKITIINFWATWCGPCKLELNNIAELYPDWQDEFDVQLIAVSIDDSRNTAKVKTYINGHAWDYTVLLDANQDLKRALNFQAPPFTLLLDKEGTIVSTHTGYKEGDEFVLEDEIKELAEK